MTPQQWEDTKRLFHEALDHPSHSRMEWLAARCAGAAEVRAEVERLVTAHLAAGSFIEKPAVDLHPRPESRPGARVGAWLGHYRLDALLGAGGMGEVYEALDSDLGRTVAIKVVGHDEAAAHERLRREARHASHLNHPNICTIHHVGDDDGRPYVVMELVEGRPLADLIPAGGLPAPTVASYACQILAALDHAHERGVIHRDLKSANVIVGHTGHVKLLDFGLAKRLDVAVAAPSRFSTSIGPVTAGAGTLPYMAPELVRGQAADARSDLWAFGVLLYEMAAGRLPFTGGTVYEIGSAILNGTPVPLPGSVPAPLAACITHCLQNERDDRPRRAADLKAPLEALAEGTSAAVAAERAMARGSLPPAAPERSRSVYRWIAAAAVFAIVALAAAAFAWRWRQPAAGAGQAMIRTLAVLPLEDLSADPAPDYFADGITEALIEEFRTTGGLRVTPPATAMRYRGTRKSLPELAKELRVDAIVHGSVLRDGDRVRIAATLLRGGDRRLWTDRFERPAREILALQRDVVRAAADHIALALTQQDEARLARVRSVDPGVYESYLKGRFHWNKRTESSLAAAVEHFRAAVEADPTYAPAHVGLADCYNQLGTVMVGSGSPARLRPQAIASAIAALQIDPGLGQAHAALAYARHYEWQWEAAGRAFTRALELDPNNALVHLWYANYLASLRRLDEAVAHVAQARELDPLSPIVQTNVGWTLSHARRYSEAVTAYREALALDPDYLQAHMRLASAYSELGQFDAALEHAATVVRLTGRTAYSLARLAYVHAAAGRRREAERLLQEILVLARTQYLSPYAVGQLYLKLGDLDRGFEWMERAYEERSNGIAYLAVEPVFDTVRSDPRLADLLKRVGLPRPPS